MKIIRFNFHEYFVYVRTGFLLNLVHFFHEI